MDFYMFQETFQIVHRAVEYIKGEGALCPICARFGLGQHRLMVTSTPGDGLRYARCPHCNFTFKTVEKVIVVKSTETLAPVPLRVHSKSRKTRRK